MTRPKLSIIIPVYNPTHFLVESLQTIQKEPVDVEIILVDDASEHLPVDFKDLAVTLLSHKTNRGPAAAMNTGLSAARGDYIAFLDQDDILVPGSLRWRASWLQERSTEQAVMGAVAGIVDERKQQHTTYKMVLRRRLFEVPDRLSYKHFVAGGWVPLSPLALCLFRRKLLEQAGELDENLKRAHDREYLYRILKLTDIPYVDRSVIFYRLHEDNLSISIKNGRIVPHRRTVAELFLINEAYGIPFPSKES